MTQPAHLALVDPESGELSPEAPSYSEALSLSLLNQLHDKILGYQATGPNPSGLCMCGCGRRTPLAAQSRSNGLVKGQPTRYVSGHGAPPKRQPMAPRFWAKVKRGEGCWEWQGARNRSGYGLFQLGRRNGGSTLAHRVAWWLHHGTPPDVDVHVCHHCDNPPCCNPAHLFLGTDADNHADKVAKGRQTRGEQIIFAKLTEARVREARRLFATGTHTLADLAERYGVVPATVRRAVEGETWRHVA
jgi:hypothetical protein